MTFPLDFLKRQQERDTMPRHWYQTGCTCEACQDTRKAQTVPWPVVEQALKKEPSKKQKRR